MKEPNEEIIRDLLEKLHQKGIPNWSTQHTLDAYEQLKRLYYHWFRKDFTEDKG